MSKVYLNYVIFHFNVQPSVYFTVFIFSIFCEKCFFCVFYLLIMQNIENSFLLMLKCKQTSRVYNSGAVSLNNKTIAIFLFWICLQTTNIWNVTKHSWIKAKLCSVDVLFLISSWAFRETTPRLSNAVALWNDTCKQQISIGEECHRRFAID